MKKTLLHLSVLLCCFTAAAVEEKGLQLSLIPDVALQPPDVPIHGVSLNLFGMNEQHGLTLGVGNWMISHSSGFSLGVLNVSDSYCGVQWGFINYVKEDFSGWMWGGFNYVKRDFTGLQVGGINCAGYCDGVQLGFLNYVDDLHGVQVGFLNIVTRNPWFSDFPYKLAAAFPFVNWSF